jgi:hypothetical protein
MTGSGHAVRSANNYDRRRTMTDQMEEGCDAFKAALDKLVRGALDGGLSITKVSNALNSAKNVDCFGLCPICHETDGFANAGKSHVFYCREHKTSWCVGTNLFSSWREQTEEEQRRIWNEIGLEEFEDVKPYFYPRGEAALRI